MFIYICCAGGGSSSLFCARITAAINDTDENLTAQFVDLPNAMATPLRYRDKADLTFVYGAAGAIRPADAYDFGSLFDVVLIAPQVRYLTPKIQACLADYPTVVGDMNSRVFGLMDGHRGYSALLDQLLVLDLMRGYRSGLDMATKRGDKSLEVLVYGASRTDAAIVDLVAALRDRGIRCLQAHFALDQLYDFHPHEDFEVRLLFGAHVTADIAAKVGRRIDGVLRFTDHPERPAKARWDADYQIPRIQLDAHLLDAHGDRAALLDRVLTFLQAVDAVAQGTSNVTVARFETPPPERETRTFLGLFTYQK